MNTAYQFPNSNRLHVKRFVSMAVATCAVMIGGCASPLIKPDIDATTDVRLAATPNAAPQSTITNFTESLRCMDEKLARYEISGLLIGAQEVFDAASEVAGTTDMLLTSLSTMSRNSKAFGIVTLSQDLSDVAQYYNLHGNQNFQSPDFFIRLSSPQIDRGVQTNQAGGGVGVLGAGEVQYSRDRIASVVSLDMNLGTVRNLQLLPGIYSSNSIAVLRKGSATDLSGEIQKLGAVFRITNDNSEGFHHSVRTLIELGAIEVVGRLTQIPYWECLDIESTNPAVQAQIQDWYAGLSVEERVKFTQGKLSALGFYQGEINGIDDQSLHTAIATYKAKQGLIADGEIDFLLYYNLIIDQTPVVAHHVALLQNTSNDNNSTASSRAPLSLDNTKLVPLELQMKTSRGDSRAVYRAGENVDLSIEVSNDAHVFCYYQQGDGGVIKIFPNRFRPYSRLSAGEELTIPGNDSFQIKTNKAGENEQLMCMASYENIEENLPPQLSEKDLQTLPVDDLEQIMGFYRAVAQTLPLRKTIELEVIE